MRLPDTFRIVVAMFVLCLWTLDSLTHEPSCSNAAQILFTPSHDSRMHYRVWQKVSH